MNIEPASMHKKIKEISGSNSCSSSCCLKAKDGIGISEIGNILEIWTEYIGEFFLDNRDSTNNSEEHDKTENIKSVDQAAVAKMRNHKAAGPVERSRWKW